MLLFVAAVIAVIELTAPHHPAPQIASTSAASHPAGQNVPSTANAGGSGSAAAAGGATATPTVSVKQESVVGETVTYGVLGAPSLDVQATLHAREWLQVTADGRPVAAKAFTAGQTLSWNANSTLSILIGNPPRVEMAVDGVSLAPLRYSHPVTLVFQVRKS